MKQSKARILLVTVTVGALVASVAGSATGQTAPADVAKTANLVPNGGFDIADRSGHPADWAVDGNIGGTTIIATAANLTAGKGSLRITNAANGTITVTSPRAVAAPGQTYTVTAKVKGASGTLPVLSLVFTSFENVVLDTRAVSPTFSTEFQTVTVQGVAPEKTANVSVRIAASPTEAGQSYWDEVWLAQSPAAYDPALGTSRELFLDDYRIESVKDMGRVVHPADKLPDPVIRPENPWEQAAYIYGSVFKIGDTYRMWYDCNNDVDPFYYLCYAESRDGKRWTKPLGRGNIGYKDIPASKTNLIVAGGGTIAYNPDAPPERRYALMQFRKGDVNLTLGYYAMFSPDGYTWTDHSPGKPVLLDGDVSNVTWDARTKKYIATIKKRMFTSGTPGTYNRSAFVSTSTDFVNWTTPILGVSGDHADTGAAKALGGVEGQIYGMPVLPYESTYVGLPWVFLITGFTRGTQSNAGSGPIWPEIASSRDLVSWSRPVRGPVLEPGKPGAWDDGAVYTASNVLVTDREIQLYYGAFNADHGGPDNTDPNAVPYKGQTGLATWRRDGFVSLTNAARRTSGDPGFVVTKPLTFTGKQLELNARTHDLLNGFVKVEVLDGQTGQVVPGFEASKFLPVIGDQHSAQAHWLSGAKLSTLAGRSVKFKFYVQGADLYSYWVR